MTERHLENSFKQLSINQASYDDRIAGIVEWICNGETDKLRPEQISDADFGEMVADVADHYNLSSDEIHEAMVACEERMFVEGLEQHG